MKDLTRLKKEQLVQIGVVMGAGTEEELAALNKDPLLEKLGFKNVEPEPANDNSNEVMTHDRYMQLLNQALEAGHVNAQLPPEQQNQKVAEAYEFLGQIIPVVVRDGKIPKNLQGRILLIARSILGGAVTLGGLYGAVLGIARLYGWTKGRFF